MKWINFGNKRQCMKCGRKTVHMGICVRCLQEMARADKGLHTEQKAEIEAKKKQDRVAKQQKVARPQEYIEPDDRVVDL